MGRHDSVCARASVRSRQPGDHRVVSRTAGARRPARGWRAAGGRGPGDGDDPIPPVVGNL